jgi:hypothetical protein
MLKNSLLLATVWRWQEYVYTRKIYNLLITKEQLPPRKER